MLLKSTDDPTRRLQLLEALRSSPRLDRWQKGKLDEYLQRKKTGLQGERDAAHYIDTHLRDGENHAVLHDFRFEIDGFVAQIDHLIIGRGFHFYLLESKNFGGNLHINDLGEFTAEYGRERFGISSPLEQSRRHEAMFVRLLEDLGISGRFTRRPTVFHAVLLHPRAMITRPAAGTFDTSMIIKADQFDTWRQKKVDSLGVATVLWMAANVASMDTITEWGRTIAARHKPEDALALPDWLKPQPEKARPPAPVRLAVREADPKPYAAVPPNLVAPSPTIKTAPHAEPRKLICATCGEKISFPEGKFCWNNEKRFGGLQYCREHQKAF